MKIYKRLPIDEVREQLTECEIEVAELLDEMIEGLWEANPWLDQNYSWDQVLLVCADVWSFEELYPWTKIYPTLEEQNKNFKELCNVSAAYQKFMYTDIFNPVFSGFFEVLVKLHSQQEFISRHGGYEVINEAMGQVPKEVRKPSYSKANEFVSAACHSYKKEFSELPPNYLVLMAWVYDEGHFIGYKDVTKDSRKVCWRGGSVSIRHIMTAFEALIDASGDVL